LEEVVMKRLLIALILLVPVVLHALSPGIDSRLTVIGGSSREEELVREALDAALCFYEGLGYAIPESERLTVVFAETISLGGVEITYAHGIYDSRNRTVYMVEMDSARFRASKILRLPACEELYFSILVHECAHFINSCICSTICISLDECLACTVQLSCMDSRLRDQVLGRGGAVPVRFRTYREITLGAYIADPDGFVLGSYAFGKDNPRILARILEGRAAPVKDPMLME